MLLLIQVNLSSTREACLVNKNYNSFVDLTAAAEVKGVATLPHSGGCVNYKDSRVGVVFLRRSHIANISLFAQI